MVSARFAGPLLPGVPYCSPPWPRSLAGSAAGLVDLRGFPYRHAAATRNAGDTLARRFAGLDRPEPDYRFCTGWRLLLRLWFTLLNGQIVFLKADMDCFIEPDFHANMAAAQSWPYIGARYPIDPALQPDCVIAGNLTCFHPH